MLYVFISFLIADMLCWFIYYHERNKLYKVLGLILAALTLMSLAACIVLAVLANG